MIIKVGINPNGSYLDDSFSHPFFLAFKQRNLSECRRVILELLRSLLAEHSAFLVILIDRYQLRFVIHKSKAFSLVGLESRRRMSLLEVAEKKSIKFCHIHCFCLEY